MTPLMLIPGMMCDGRMWSDIASVVPDRMVIHAPITNADTVQELAALILADAPPVFALAGLSMGGIVAMELARQAPDRIERLALLDTNPLAEAPEVAARRQGQIDRVLAGNLAAVMREELKPNYLAPGLHNAPVLDLCLDMALGLGPQVFVRQSVALRDRADQQDTLAGFDRPALVLMGEHDMLCPRERHDLMLRLMPQARLVIVPGAGHLPTLEQPAETLREMVRWLQA